jgi:hypothetical protein
MRGLMNTPAPLTALALVCTLKPSPGESSSVCQRVLERLDAELSETGDNGQPSVAAAQRAGDHDAEAFLRW